MAKVIMIQGTMSGAGKSLLVAGLCRIFHQDGYRVAPFKSQNMALNSFITNEGLEMGRAQVLQAQAAGREPEVAMNPILLKPMSDIGSQVIVNGKVLGNMSAKEYFSYKKQLLPQIKEAYDKLDAENDIIVIEGAGSPVEINLKENDIVNMGIAKLVDAPVLIVGDIDRGGVFAQLVGTMVLLEEEEKKRVKGLIVNKFRGDRSILEPGLAMLEEKSNCPVVGVVPFVPFSLEDEDSLTTRFSEKKTDASLDVAVIHLPHISNFTDFLALENQEEIGLRYVAHPEELGVPDLVILPGTKNTFTDLRWLRESGMEAAVVKAKQAGTTIFGICGGYQMLGKTLYDPDCVEAGGQMAGLGFLPMETIFSAEKVRTRVHGRFGTLIGSLASLSGKTLSGYEIHMGRTITLGDVPLPFVTSLTDEKSGEQKEDGAYASDVYGTYVHGCLDDASVIQALIEAIADKKGISFEKRTIRSAEEVREEQLDLLADTVRNGIDLDAVYHILGINREKKS